MRFLIYGIFLSGWVAMWMWTYTCHIKMACCAGRFAMEIPVGEDRPELMTPIAFEEFSSEPKTGTHLPVYRDSVIAKLDSGNVLAVTGLYTSGEQPRLGMERARSVLDILAPQLEAHRFELNSLSMDEELRSIRSDGLLLAFNVEIRTGDVIADSLSEAKSR